MRLVTYRAAVGVPSRTGAIVDRGDGDVVVDLGAAGLPGDMTSLLALGPEGRSRAAAVTVDADVVPLDAVELLAPIARPPKLLATAANYQAHITEAGLPEVDKMRIVPKLFLKPASTIIGPDVAMRLPSISHEVDWELELAAVIGAEVRDVGVDEALDAVAGYTIVNDVSARSVDWGLSDRDAAGSEFFDWLQGKWPDGFAPMGPWIRTAEEIPDPQHLSMELRVNGTVRQSGSTASMIFSVAEVIAFASRFMTLEPGDVIATGTPAGVGATTQQYLQSGDVMEGKISGLGVLRTPVVAP